MRNNGLELLRGLAAFGIVGCHLMLSPLTESAAVLKHFCDFNVAVFAVVAGFLMYDSVNRMKIGEYIRHRVARIVPIYLVWSGIFSVASIVLQSFQGGLDARFGKVSYWIDVLLRGGASCHLWFLVCLMYGNVILCLAKPLLLKGHGLIMGVTFVFLSTTGGTWYHDYLFRMIGFLVIGYGARQVDCFGRQNSMWMWAGLCVLALVMHVLLKSVVPGFIRDLIAVVPVVGLFVDLNTFFPVQSKLWRIAGGLGAYSMGVYLIHPLLTRIMAMVAAKAARPPYGIGIVALDWCFCFGMAFLLSCVLGSIPVVRKAIR